MKKRGNEIGRNNNFRRGHVSNIRNGRLGVTLAEIDKVEEKKIGNVVIVSMPIGTTTETINLYRYMRLLTYKEAVALAEHLTCSLDKFPLDKVCRNVMLNMEEDVAWFIQQQIVTTIADMGLVGGKVNELE